MLKRNFSNFNQFIHAYIVQTDEDEGLYNNFANELERKVEIKSGSGFL